jgi:putative membrane protein
MMVDDHQKDLAAFQAEAKNGSDADVKAFASKTSAVIKKHLDMVKAAQTKMK